MNGFIVRNAGRKEVDIMLNWAAIEGWNPGRYDAECFFAQDPNGFFVGLLDNKIIATVSAVKYDENYGFLGFYMVKPEFREKGYGMKLFRHAWNYLGERNKGGDGVLENLEKYARVGLKLAHYNSRFQGFGTGTKKIGPNIADLRKIDFIKTTDYDTSVFGFERKTFLKCWINQPKSYAYGYVKNNTLLGYGVLRKCYEGYKIGPLFADNPSIANTLFSSLVGSISKKDKVFFDPPEANSDAIQITKDQNMKKVFATGRIYTKGQPAFPLEKWYGVTTFELG